MRKLSLSRRQLKRKDVCGSWFWNLNRTIRSDWENRKPFIFAILLASRTALWEKSKDPCELRSDLTVLRTVIRPLLMVPCFLLNLNLKKKKKTHTHTHIEKNKRKRNTIAGSLESTGAAPGPPHSHRTRSDTATLLWHANSPFFFFFRSSKSLSLL